MLTYECLHSMRVLVTANRDGDESKGESELVLGSSRSSVDLDVR